MVREISRAMVHEAFISYSTRDKAAADAACAALEAMGIRCWIAPRDVTPGAEWGEAIIEAINRSRVMVLIFSANANESPQIRREVERAVSKGIPILPLRIQDVAPAGSLEFFIGTVHWLDALTAPLEAHLLRLGETVKTLLQIDPAAPRILRPVATAPPAPGRRTPVAIAATLVAAGAGAIVAWRLVTAGPAPPAAEPSSSRPVAPTSVASAQPAEPAATHLATSPTPPSPQATAPAVPAAAPSATPPSPAAIPSPAGQQSSPQAGPAAAPNPALTPPAPAAALPPPSPQATAPAAAPAATLPTPEAPPPPVAKPLIDPALVGSFAYNGVVDDYDERIDFSVGVDGAYRLTTTLTEDGVYASGGGKYRTTANRTGRVRAGTYRAVGDAAIEVTSATGTAIFRPERPTAPLDPRNPAMLGVWRATVTLNGAPWTLTIDNAPDRTYRYEARAEDEGACVYADQKWRAVSRLTGAASSGAYRVLDRNDVEITGPAGSAVWRRQ